jgi:hypothetical protein
VVDTAVAGAAAYTGAEGADFGKYAMLSLIANLMGWEVSTRFFFAIIA